MRRPRHCHLIKLKPADPEQHGPGEAAERGGGRPAGGDAADAVQCGRRRARAWRRPWMICAPRPPGGREGRRDILVLSDRGVDRDQRADSVAAGDRGRAPPPDPRRHAHAGGAGDRNRRGPRSPSLLPADRLRGRGDQPVSGVRDAGRHAQGSGVWKARPARTSPWRRPSNNYTKAANKAILKVASKMGISTVQSYRGAQIFRGHRPGQSDVIDKYFTNTPSAASAAWAWTSSPANRWSGTAAASPPIPRGR